MYGGVLGEEGLISKTDDEEVTPQFLKFPGVPWFNIWYNKMNEVTFLKPIAMNSRSKV